MGFDTATTRIYYGEFDKIGGAIPPDPFFFGVARKELVLLGLLFDTVCIPPKSIIEHPIALPVLGSLAAFVKNGKIGTSFNEDDRNFHELTHLIIENFLMGIRKNTMRSDFSHIRKRADRMKRRVMEVFPKEPIYYRNVDNQIHGFSEGIVNYLEFLYLMNGRKEYNRFLKEAGDRFDIRTGSRALWVANLGRFYNRTNLRAWNQLLIGVHLSYLRQGERANQAQYFPGKFMVRIRKDIRDYPDFLMPATLNTSLSYDNIINVFNQMNIDIESALTLPGDALYEIATSAEMKRLSTAILNRLLDPGGNPSELISGCGEKKIKKTFPDESLRRFLESRAFSACRLEKDLLFLRDPVSLPWTKLGRVIATTTCPGAFFQRDIQFDPFAGTLTAGHQKIALKKNASKLFAYLLIHRHLEILTSDVEMYVEEWDTVESATKPLKTDYRSILAYDYHLPARKERIFKMKQRLSERIRPLGLRIELARNRWKLIGFDRVSIYIEGGEANRPPVVDMPKYLQPLYSALSEAYPAAVSHQDLLTLFGYKDDETQKLYWVKRDLINYLAINVLTKGRWTIKSHGTGNYRLVDTVQEAL